MNVQVSLLGLSGHISRQQIGALVDSLSSIWKRSMGRAPGQLKDDLARCRRLFDPVAQGQRLRRELSAIPAIDEETWDPGPPLTLPVGSGRFLVTPEGRCVLDLLVQFEESEKGYVITDARLISYDRLLGHLYRDWSRHRIESVVGLLAGRQRPLQIAAAGVVIALLINRSTSPKRALKRFASGAARDVVDEAFFEAIKAFARALSPRQRPSRDPRLISGWMLYEARRRLGDNVLIIEPARPDTDARLWINESKQEEVLDLVARDLSRRHRARVSVEALEAALSSLVDAFRAEAHRLAGFGLTHEQPANTRRVCSGLVEKFQQYAED